MADNIDDVKSLFSNDSPPLPKTKSKFKLVSRAWDQALREKYRPHKLEEVIPTCSIEHLRSLIDNPTGSQVFLFEGDTGTGKTTCAKIIGKAFVCQDADSAAKPCLECKNCLEFEKKSIDVTELNIAKDNKIDTIRDIVDNLKYRPVILNKKIYIFDEIQRLSDEAQQVLLTEVEKPSKHNVIFLCTMNINKVNKALIDRTTRITFNPLPAKLAGGFIDYVLSLENIEDVSQEIKDSFFYKSGGSVRAILNSIETFKRKGYSIEESLDENEAVVKDIFLNIKRGNWKDLSQNLRSIKVRENPEKFRISLESYMRGVILKTPSLDSATQLGTALMRITGDTRDLPTSSQYNHLVLKCLRACNIFHTGT